VRLLPPLLLLAASSAVAAQPAPRQSERYCTEPQYRALDFWVGDWDLQWRGSSGAAEHASSRVSRDELGNCAIVERMEWPNGQYRMIGISVYDGHAQVWRQTFVDNEGHMVSLSGGPSDEGGAAFVMTADRPDERGRQRRMVWSDAQPDRLTWRWERRDRDADPWVADWVVEYRRR
jgi:hypothetical protein